MTETTVEGIELDELQANTDTTATPLDLDLSLINHLQVELNVHVGEAQCSVEELFNAKPGDVLKMKQTVDTPVKLTLNDKVVAEGFLVAVGDNFGVKISKLINS